MVLLDLAEEMQLSQNKCNLLNKTIENERRAAKPEDLDKLQIEWAEEMVRLNLLTVSFRKKLRA
jgi:hypothetical protein